MKKLIAFLGVPALVFIIGATANFRAFAQASAPTNTEEFIHDLRQSVLLVRLQDKSKTISTLEEMGEDLKASLVAQEQQKENREILLSFTQTFDFCPVYFFYAKDSEQIRKGELEELVFDANLRPVAIDFKKYYTAEFAKTPSLGIEGLILMDNQLLYLDNKLPYFERRFVFFNLKDRSKAEMAEAYNQRLYKYLEHYSAKWSTI